MADDYTPTTEEVVAMQNDEFPCWLAEHDRQVAEKAWDEGVAVMRWRLGESAPTNPYRETEADRG